MIQAYRNVDIEIEADGQVLAARVPLTIGLMLKVEQAVEDVQKSNGWWRGRRKSALDVYREFCEPYLPESLDRERLQPAFYSLFFSTANALLMDSLRQSMNSTAPTETPPAPTGGRTKEGPASAP